MTDVLGLSRVEKLNGVHPRLIEIVKAIVYAMNELGYHMIVTDGVRTVAQQQALYAKGRTVPGSIVTNADGVVKKSNHQSHSDGFGHAVDMCFMDDNGTPDVPSDDKPSWSEKYPWRLYGEMAKAKGCTWGGDWKSIHDLPHIEWPDGAA